MPFHGFAQSDFDIFDLPDFSIRMPTLREQITPKLKLLAEDMVTPISKITGTEMFIHVAAHLRRTVNPPEETWAAYAREKRAYKPFVHFRTAINRNGIKIACFLEDYADDKETFAEALHKNSAKIARHIKMNPQILSYDMMDPYGKPLAGRSLNKAALEAFAERLLKTKSQHSSFGIFIPRTEPVVENGEALTKLIRDSIETLLPIYELGLPKTRSRKRSV